MSSTKKNKISSTKETFKTPLHLLHDLTGALVSSLQKACTQAQKEAEKTSAKHKKQRIKVKEQLSKAQQKLIKANKSGKLQSQNSAKKDLAELKRIDSKLETQQKNLLKHISTLKKDSAKSLALAKNISKVKERALNLLEKPQKTPTITKKAKVRKSTAKGVK